MNHAAFLPLSAAGLAVVGAATLPGISAIVVQNRNRTPKDNFYEDIDGKSTPEAVAAFSQKIPKTAILLLSVVGFGLSVAISVLSTLNSGPHGLFVVNWLSTATWVSAVESCGVVYMCFSMGESNSCL